MKFQLNIKTGEFEHIGNLCSFGDAIAAIGGLFDSGAAADAVAAPVGAAVTDAGALAPATISASNYLAMSPAEQVAADVAAQAGSGTITMSSLQAAGLVDASGSGITDFAKSLGISSLKDLAPYLGLAAGAASLLGGTPQGPSVASVQGSLSQAQQAAQGPIFNSSLLDPSAVLTRTNNALPANYNLYGFNKGPMPTLQTTQFKPITPPGHRYGGMIHHAAMGGPPPANMPIHQHNLMAMGYAHGGADHSEGALNQAVHGNPHHVIPGEFSTKNGQYFVQGQGDGQSDNIPAMLAQDEFVWDASTVSRIGNGSSKAGAKVLDATRKMIAKDAGNGVPQRKVKPLMGYLRKAQNEVLGIKDKGAR